METEETCGHCQAILSNTRFVFTVHDSTVLHNYVVCTSPSFSNKPSLVRASTFPSRLFFKPFSPRPPLVQVRPRNAVAPRIHTVV